MGVVKEVIYTIDFYSPPLKKHRYSMDSVFRKARPKKKGGTGVLFDEIERRERLAREKEAAEAAARAALEAEAMLNATPSPQLAIPEPAETEPEKPKRQFRAIRKVEKILFDDTAEQLGRLEDESFETLNADGYYDEILPVDADVDYDTGPSLPVKALIIMGCLFVAAAAFVIWQMSSIF